MFEEQFKKWIDMSMDMSGMSANPMKDNPQFQSFMDLFTGKGDKKE
jgi:hypothetical protein